MAPVPPEGCLECVCEGGEVDGDIGGGDDHGVNRPATDPLLSALEPSMVADLPVGAMSSTLTFDDDG